MKVTDILNLPGWSVTDVEEREECYVILARPALSHHLCPHCRSSKLIGHGKDHQVLHDLPCHGKQVVIEVHHQRHFCKDCGKTCFEPLPQVEDRHHMTTPGPLH